MHTIGTGLGICPTRRNVLQEGERSPLGVVPMKLDTECLDIGCPDTGCLDTGCLDMGCRSVVEYVKLCMGGWVCHSSIGH